MTELHPFTILRNHWLPSYPWESKHVSDIAFALWIPDLETLADFIECPREHELLVNVLQAEAAGRDANAVMISDMEMDLPTEFPCEMKISASLYRVKLRRGH